MGDGSACRTHKAPGYFDARAEAFDEAVADALAGADVDCAAGHRPGAGRTAVVCRPARWQVLAGLVATDGRRWSGDLHYDEAPYGVGYLVATLAPTGDGES